MANTAAAGLGSNRETNATEKIIMITGATSGIGKATAEILIEQNPTHLYLLCRNAKKGEAVSQELRLKAPNVIITVVLCDLSSFKSIREAASRFSLLTSRLDILICNAGEYTSVPTVTEEGYEIHFGVNHLGHALLIKLLLPTLHKTASLEPHDVRIIFVASADHRRCPPGGILFAGLKTTMAGINYKQRYGQSKLANVLYAREMAKHYPDMKIMAIHPGCVATNKYYNVQKRYLHSDRLVSYFSRVCNSLHRRFRGKLLTPIEGAELPVWCATANPTHISSGAYYDSTTREGSIPSLAENANLAADLWTWTQSIVTSVPFDDNTIRETVSGRETQVFTG